ncbi:MAG: hypothetical protein Q9194_000378 [Teloschistes cf. exilis]
MPISTNRTLWPVTGGAVGIQPGWFPGHSSAFFYINLGEGTIPQNYSLPMQQVFQILGPSNQQYDGSFCLPQVPLPANYTAKIGDNATIQVVETAQHGAALYNVGISHLFEMERETAFPNVLRADLSCVDITFADPKDVPEVNETNCVNSTDIGFDLVFSTTSLSSAATPTFTTSRTMTAWMASVPLVVAGVVWNLML